MKRNENPWYQHFKLSVLLMTGFTALLVGVSPKQAGAVNLGGATHIGTFEGQTTFQTSSSNGINPGLYLEVMDRYGNYKTYTSEDGVITVDGTKEGAYVTQAKLLGKTKYRDVQTGELLDQWEDGRDLKLESVKMPVLTTTGKNLFNINDNFEMGYINEKGEISLTDRSDSFERKNNGFSVNVTSAYGGIVSNYIEVNQNTEYLFIFNQIGNYPTQANIIFFNKDKEAIGGLGDNRLTESFTTPPSCSYLRVGFWLFDTPRTICYEDIQLQKTPVESSYEPYKSNILTTSEEVELRGIGDVKDELDLLTGKVTQRFHKTTIDENYSWSLDGENNGYLQFGTALTVKGNVGGELKGASNGLPYGTLSGEGSQEQVLVFEHRGWITQLRIMINPSRLETPDVKGFIKYITNNPLELIYAQQPTVKTVDLTSTYTFGTVAMRDVYVDGKVKPLLCSVNVPTENLTFVLDPNQEEEKQFIAPTFRLINETPTSVRVSLTAFKQESNVFNDVSPTKYENWSQLNKEQSKDIALALVPLASDNWVTVDETPRYVNNYSASVLGEIKAKSSVDLTFKALHGQAFTEELNPQYRLVFLFDF